MTKTLFTATVAIAALATIGTAVWTLEPAKRNAEFAPVKTELNVHEARPAVLYTGESLITDRSTVLLGDAKATVSAYEGGTDEVSGKPVYTLGERTLSSICDSKGNCEIALHGAASFDDPQTRADLRDFEETRIKMAIAEVTSGRVTVCIENGSCRRVESVISKPEIKIVYPDQVPESVKSPADPK
jgi:hypothetical protein